MPSEQAILERSDSICLALPEAIETTTFGHPQGQLARGLGVRVVAEEREADARRAALDELTALSDELGFYD